MNGPDSIRQLGAALHTALDALATQLEAETTSRVAAATKPPIRCATVDEIAERLQVSKTYVQKLVRRGQLPSIRFGRWVRIPEAGFEEFIRKRQTLRRGRVAAIA